MIRIIRDFLESSCLGLQLKVGGKLHLRLNMGKRPIVNKYREGKVKRTLKKEWKSTWNRYKVNRRWVNCWMVFNLFNVITNVGLITYLFLFPLCAYLKRFVLKCVSDENIYIQPLFVPSWNTDQGVYPICE